MGLFDDKQEKEGFLEKTLREKVEGLSRKSAAELTKSLCKLLRIFESRPSVGGHVVFLLMNVRAYSPGDERNPWDKSHDVLCHTEAQALCLRILDQETGAEGELEQHVVRFLQANEELSRRRKRRSVRT